MKNKNYLYGMLLLAGSLVSTGCTDMLDKEPLDKSTNSPVFWNNASSVESYAASFYNLFTGYGNYSGTGDFYFRFLSDDQVGASFQQWKYTNAPASNSDWSATYEEIRRANSMIESLESLATEMDETTKNHWIGVARLMRGWQHWDIVRKFGDVVWVDHVPDVNDPVLFAAREDRDAVMDKVLEDLKFACQNIEESSTKQYWSRNMAYALTARICLWEGTFRKYRTQAENGKAPDTEGSTRFLNECVTACEYLMPQYALCDNYQSLYNSTDLSGNSEIIFCKEYAQDQLRHTLINYLTTSTEQSGMSKDAFDAYLFLDGNTAANTTLDNTAIPVKKLSANDNLEHLNIKAMLEVRDKRLAQTIDTILCYQTEDGITGWPRLAGGMNMTSSSGYSVCKYDNVTIPQYYRETGAQNYTWAPLFWLAEVYLNYAEAKAELGTITNDDLNNTINLLKTRAGLPPITTAVADQGDNNMGVSPLIWEIRRERRCELMFDNDFRYWDLIRWHQLDKLDTKNYPDIILGANVSNEPNISKATTAEGYINGSIIEGTQFERTYHYRHYLYPIPTGQITLNPALGQNPGWNE